MAASFSYFIWNWSLALHIQPDQGLRLIGALNRSRKFRNSKINSFSNRCCLRDRLRHCLSSLKEIQGRSPSFESI